MIKSTLLSGRFWLVAAAFAASISSSTNAAVIVMTSPDGFYDLQLTDPVAVGNGSENLQSVILQVVNKRPQDAQANASTFNGSIGINGNLHHERLFNVLATPTSASFTGAGQAASSIDSYFNNVGLTIAAPAEGGAATPSAEPALSNAANGTDFGFNLSANIGLASQNAVTDIAQLVFAQGASIGIDFGVANGIIGATPSLFVGEISLAAPPTPIALSSVPTGSAISLQGAFDDLSGTLEDAIMVSTDIAADPGIAITDLIIGGPNASLFSAVVDAVDPTKIDLKIDVAAAQLLPLGTSVSASLQVLTTYGGDFNYTLGAVVPEPSSIILGSLALVGFVAFRSRSK